MPNTDKSIIPSGLKPTVTPANIYPYKPNNPSLSMPFDATYDVGLREGMNQQWVRSDSQSGGEQLLKGFVSRAGSIVPKIVSGFGSVLYGARAVTPFGKLEDVWDNPITNWAQESDQQLADLLPVYKSRNYDESGLLGKMATTSFWASDAMDGIAYAASAYVPGAGIGKLGNLAGKALSSSKIGARVLEGLNAIGVNANRANLVASTAYNTVSEAAVEALQTRQELEAIYQTQGLNPQEARLKAAEAAKETFWMNVGILAVPNFIQNKMFHGKWNDKTRQVIDEAVKTKGAAKAAQLLEARWKTITEGFMSEGLWEENAQTAVQQYERAHAKGLTEGSLADEFVDNLYSNTKGFLKSFVPGVDTTPDETEGALSIALGGLLGSGYGVISHNLESKDIEKTVKHYNEQIQNFWKNSVPAMNSILRQNITAPWKVDGKKEVDGVLVDNYVLDDKNNPVVDEDKVHKMIYSQLRDVNFWNIDLLSSFLNDKTTNDYNKQMAMLSYAYMLASNNNSFSKENIHTVLDQLAEKGENEAKVSQEDTLIRENTQQIKDYVDLMLEMSSKHRTAKDVNNPTANRFNQFMAKSEGYVRGKLRAISKLREGANEKLNAQLDILQQDAQQHLDYLTNSKDQVRETYSKVVAPIEDSYAEYQTLSKKKNKSEEELKRVKALEFSIGEDQYINGTSIPLDLGVRDNPIGFESRSTVKNVPGQLDSYHFGIGKSYIALKNTQRHLAANQTKEAAVAYSGIEADVFPDELEKVTGELLHNLETERDLTEEKLNQRQTHLGIFSVVDPNDDEWSNEISISEYLAEKRVDPSLIPSFLEDIGIDPNTPADSSTLERIETFGDNVKLNLAEANIEDVKNIISLNNSIDHVGNSKQRISDKKNRFNELLKSDNPTLELKKEYYNKVIAAPAKALIEDVNKYPKEAGENELVRYFQARNNLQNALEAYESRTDSNNPTDYVITNAKELLSKLDKDILPIIRKNIESSIELQKESNAVQVESIVRNLKVNEEINSLIKEILQDEYSRLFKSVNQSYDAAELLLFTIRSKATKEQLEKLEKAITAHKQELLATTYQEIIQQFPELKKAFEPNFIGKYQFFGLMPSQVLPFLISNIFSKELEDESSKNEPLQRYLKDLDIFTFLINLESYSVPEAKKVLVREVVSIHDRLVGLSKITSRLTNTLDYSKFLDLKSKLTIAPSLQQNIVLNDALNFLAKPVTSISDYENWMLVNGIAGSGKTHMVAKVVTTIWAALNSKSVTDNIYAFSARNTTSSNINKAVFDSDLHRTLDNFLALTDEQLSKIDVLIVDEVYTFNQSQFEAFSAKLFAHFNTTKHAIKVIALGDPSQKSTEYTPVIRTNLAPAVTHTIPLTTTYRTSVNSISLFSKSYRSKASEVTGSFATANKSYSDMAEDVSTAFGVYAGSTEEVLALARTTSSRSRALVVGTSLDKQTFSNLVPIDVFTVDEIQGEQRDEIYVIVDPTSQGSSWFERNQGLYTAFSRPKALLIIADQSIPNTPPDSSLDSSSKEADVTLEQNRQLYDQTLKAATNMLNGVTETSSTIETAPQEFKIADAPVEDESIASPASFSTIVEPEIIIRVEEPKTGFVGEHRINYPTNYSLTPFVDTDGTRHSKVAINSVGKIIKSSNKKGDLYYLIAPYALAPNRWLVIGTLSKKDTDQNPGLATLLSEKAANIDQVYINERGPFSLSDDILSKGTVGEFTVSSYKPLTNIITENYVRSEVMDPIEYAIIQFRNTYFGTEYPAEVYDDNGNPDPNKDWVVNNKVNWRALKGKVQFRIATNKYKDVVARDNPNVTLMEGAPYLVLTDVRQKGSSKDSGATFYIPFQPIPLQRNSDIVIRISELRDLIAELENLFFSIGNSTMFLGSNRLGELVHKFAANNFHIKSETDVLLEDTLHVIRKVEPNSSIISSSEFEVDPRIALQVDNLLLKIVPLTFGIEKKTKFFETESEARNFLVKNGVKEKDSWVITSVDIDKDTKSPKKHRISDTITKTKNGKFVLQEITSIENPEDTERYEEYQLISGEGRVQRDLNNLATANKAVSGRNIRIQQKEVNPGHTHTLNRAKTLFPYDSKSDTIVAPDYLDLNGFINDDEVIATGWDLNTYDKNSESSAMAQWLNYAAPKLDTDYEIGRKKALALYQKYSTRPITIQTLNAIVDDFNGNDHLNLRTPLQVHNFNETAVNDIGVVESGVKSKGKFRLGDDETRSLISSKVMTNWHGVSRTDLVVNFPFQTKPIYEAPKTIKEALDTIPKTGVSYLDTLVETLKAIPDKHNVKITFSNSFKILRSQLEGKALPKELDSLIEITDGSVTIIKGGKASILTVVDPKLLAEGNVKAIANLLHEMLHAYSIQALNKGNKDLKESKDSPEALFTKRIKTIQKRFHAVIARRGITKASVYAPTRSKLNEYEFIASLSHDKFYETASNIEATSTRGKSIIREIIQAIVDLFSSLFGTPNLYDVTLKAFEELYSKSKIETPTTIETSTPTEESILSEIESIVRELPETSLERVKSYSTGILNLSKLPSVETSRIFKTLPDSDRLAKLSNLLNRLRDEITDIQFAYFDKPVNVVTASPGSIISTEILPKVFSKFMKPEVISEMTSEQVNLLYTLIHTQLVSPETNYVDLLGTKDLDSKDLAHILHSILSSLDKRTLLSRTGLSTLDELEHFIYDKFGANDLTQDFYTVAEIVRDNYSDILSIVGDVQDRMASTYRAARQYMMSLVKKNRELENSSSELIRTPWSLRQLIETKASFPDVSETKRKLDVANSQLIAATLHGDLESINRLTLETIPSLENELTGLNALNTVNLKTGNKLWWDIYTDIFPSSPLDKVSTEELSIEIAEIFQDEWSDKDRTDEELKEASSISEYIKLYDKDYSLSTSASLKELLSTIEVNGEIVKYGIMYVVLMKAVANLEFSASSTRDTTTNIIYQINSALENEHLFNRYDRAALLVLKDILEKSKIHPVDKTITLVSHTLPNGKVLYVGATSKTIDLSNYTYDEILELSKDPIYEIRLTAALESSSSIFEAINKILLPKNKVLSKLEFNKLYAKAEAANAIRDIMQGMVSMRDTDLYIALRSFQRGIKHKLIRAKASDITFSLKEHFAENLKKKFEDNTLIRDASTFNSRKLGTTPYSDIIKTGTLAQKIYYIKDFYRVILGQSINIGLTAKDVNAKKITEIIEKMQPLLKSINDINPDILDIPDAIPVDSPQEEYLKNTFVGFLDNVDGYLTRLSELAAANSDYIRNPSVRDINGNRYYKHHESSTGFDILGAILDIHENNSVVNAATGSNSNRVIPSHLRSSIYNLNIFGRAPIKNKIYAVGEFSGSRSEDTDSVTPYLRENLTFYYHRKFAQGFVDAIRQYESQYFQSTFIPADKPKQPIVRVNILSNEDILKSTELILKQLLLKKDWSLPIKNLRNISEERLFVDFDLGLRALQSLRRRYTNYELSEVNIPEIARTVIELLEEEALSELQKLTSDDIKFKVDSRYYSALKKLHHQKLLNPRFNDHVQPIKSSESFKKQGNKLYADNRESIVQDLLPAFELFYKNDMINNYFLNQVIVGDYHAFSSAGNIIKRYASLFGPRVRGWVDETSGMQETFKVLVLDDTHESKDSLEARLRQALQVTPEEEDDFQRVLAYFDEKGYDLTDAQGFITPKRARELSRGFSRSWYRGQVHKPLHFEIQEVKIPNTNESTAVPVILKYSSIELSDEMINSTNSDLLRKFRDRLEKLGIDEAVFGSAVKSGKQLNLRNNEEFNLYFHDFINYTDEQLEEFRNLESNSILTLSNRYFGFQHNAASNVDSDVAIYSQLMYFLSSYSNVVQRELGVFPSTQEQATKVYTLVGQLIALGREDFLAKINTKAKLTEYLRDKLNSPGNERALELLDAGIGIDHPLLEKKTIISLASGLEKASIKTRFSGAKLVLQTSEGIRYTNPGATVNSQDELGYRIHTINGVKTLLVDAIVPEQMLSEEERQAVNNGEQLYMYGNGLAFRIPSTELHSAIAINIVGFYTKGSKDNVIIVPKEIVPIHGSDFDVDALFVIFREKFSESETSIITADVISSYLEQFSTLLTEINSLKEGLDDAQLQELIRYENLLKERLGVFKEDSKKDTPVVDPLTTEEDFEDWFLEQDNTNELEARKTWGNSKGLRWSNNQWVYKTDLSSLFYELDKEIRQIEKGKTNLPTKLSSSIKELSKVKKEWLGRVKETTIFGDKDAPVGYTKSNVSFTANGISYTYTWNKEFIPTLNKHLEELDTLEENLSVNVRSVFLPVIRSSRTKLKSLLIKAIKNNITESMLSVISNPTNKFRLTTPITFSIIENAIKQIPKSRLAPEEYDLTRSRSQFQAFLALSSGRVLIGAFANTGKSLSYLTESGDSPSSFKLQQEIFAIRANIKVLEAQLELATEKDAIKEQLKALESQKKELKEKLQAQRALDKSSSRAQVNPAYHFSISESGIHHHFNSLAVQNTLGQNTTAVVDTLINSATDDLNLGYLSRARISTRTGSFVSGAVALGVPLEYITKILYQPIFDKLVSGILDNTSKFISETKEQYKDQIQKLDSNPLTIEDLDKYNNLDAQLKALLIFEKAYKIGEDLRNLASFLNIIRQLEVFVEDLDKIDVNLITNIGKIVDGILVPNSDFAFITSNLLKNAAHIREAYTTYTALQDTIQENYLFQSEKVREFAKLVNKNLSLGNDDSIDSGTTNLANIRSAFKHYLLSNFIFEELDLRNLPSKVTSFTPKGQGEVKVIQSKVKTYLDTVASNLQKVKEFVDKYNETHSDKIKNTFLDNIYVNTDSLGVSFISFRGGVNLQADDNQQLSIDFRKLNRFNIVDNQVQLDTAVTPYSVSNFQKQLLNYAVLAYGLNYSSSNFSNYIPPILQKEISNWINNQANKIVNNEQELVKVLSHFKLAYAGLNASRLEYFDYDDIVSRDLPNGKAIISSKSKDGTISTKVVYYDRKVKIKPSYNLFMKEGFGNRMKYFYRVAADSEYYYYQKVGKVSDIHYSPLEQNKLYRLEEYFPTNIYTLQYFNKEGNYIWSYDKVAHIVPEGKALYISPDYSFDRLERKLVKIVSQEPFQTGKYPGIKYQVKEITEQEYINEQIKELKEQKDKGCTI